MSAIAERMCYICLENAKKHYVFHFFLLFDFFYIGFIINLKLSIKEKKNSVSVFLFKKLQVKAYFENTVSSKMAKIKTVFQCRK